MSIDAPAPHAPPADVADPVNAPGADADYAAEVRFGVVMYGGVSLAIYINGVTNEIFEMACATPRQGVTIDRDGEPASRGIYRRLSWLVGNPDLRADYAKAITAAAQVPPGADPPDVWPVIDRKDATQTRFAVDVVAGTSAGGINGLFLAKALANGEQFGALKDLWINEGDIGLLLNDERSYANTDPPIVSRAAKPASLLNSDRMYAKLHYALGAMNPIERVHGADGASPLVDEIDLFITTTDIKGSPVPLRLFDKIVYERRYKQNYHFQYPDGITQPSGNDFDAVNRSFLAFAARCTSSFPFAFEPMTLSTLTRLKVDGGAPGVKRWNDFFPNLSRAEVAAGRHVDRAFGDGGYLDNKPFSYVVDTLSKRFSSVPIERKLIFVEPSPQELDPDRPDEAPDPDREPDALQNSLSALTSIPQYETIREDLQAVLTRNRRIERIERVVRLGERSIGMADSFSIMVNQEGKVPDWSALKLSEMTRYYGTAFVPYQRLRVYAVTDLLADRLGQRWNIDGDSDQQYAMRALVRVWRERAFDDEGTNGRQTVNAFLDEFDFDYRVRRIGFILRKVDKLTRLFRRRVDGVLDTSPGTDDIPPALGEEELQMLDALPGPLKGLPATLSADRVLDGVNVLRSLKRGLLEARSRLLAASRDVDEMQQPPAGASDDAMRSDLQTILLTILGRTPDQGNAIRAQGGAGSVRIVLDDEPSRLASASRTLQESVLFRARALLHAAEQNAVTPVQAWLVAGIEAMRVKRSARAAEDVPEPALAAVSHLAWQLLGAPTLVSRDARHVEASVNAATAEGLAPQVAALLPALNAADGTLLRQFLSLYYLRFDSFDQMSFPLYYDTATGEPSTVEVVRISPVDATNLIDEETDPLKRKKLAGTALANFGAFLDRRWRLNDIMWGQLDGAERLIEALLPMSDPDTRIVRKELIERAQRGILRAALVPEGHATLADLVIKALDKTPGEDSVRADDADQLAGLFRKLWKGNAAARDSMAGVLVSLLGEPGLMEFVRKSRKTDPSADPQATLKSAARAVTITGRVLTGISKRHGAGEVVPRWLSRLGLMMQGIVAVSLPGTLNQRWWSHGMKVLYAFEAVLVALAFLFGSADMRTLAITALATTFGIHLLTLIAGDVMRSQRRWLYGAAMALFAALVILAAIGALTLVHQGVQQQLCWVRPGDVEQTGAAGWVCDRAGGLQRWWSSMGRG